LICPFQSLHFDPAYLGPERFHEQDAEVTISP
jgi:hypothetical protein